MDDLYVLLPSVFLGPAVWRPVADELRSRGHESHLVALGASTSSYDEALRAYEREVPENRSVVLVAHSNAGSYVPALVMARDVSAALFVDAVLPATEGKQPLAPPEFIRQLEPLADAGRLPVWTRWFDEADVASLFPDESTRSTVEAEQRQVLLSYLRDSAEVTAGWAQTPAGYLGFGETYAEEQREAMGRGWPVTRMAGEHLHMLVDPAEVAEAILDLRNDLRR